MRVKHQPLSADSEGLHPDSKINLAAVSQQTKIRLMQAKTEIAHRKSFQWQHRAETWQPLTTRNEII